MSTTTHATEPPDFSILMTAYNSAEYLQEALESVLAQKTSVTWELLFVDDGSSDRTLRIASEFAARVGASVRVLQHPGNVNRGISASRNLALRYARGEFVAFLDSDDVWLPHHLETQVVLLREQPDLAMVYASAERWFNFEKAFSELEARSARWGENCLPPLLPPGKRAGLLPRGELLNWFREDESLVPCICTVVVRTKVARAVGGFCNEFCGLYDDQAFHTKVLLAYEVYANDVCTARYRQHSNSCCQRANRLSDLRQTEQCRFQNFLQNYLSTLATNHSLT